MERRRLLRAQRLSRARRWPKRVQPHPRCEHVPRHVSLTRRLGRPSPLRRAQSPAMGPGGDASQFCVTQARGPVPSRSLRRQALARRASSPSLPTTIRSTRRMRSTGPRCSPTAASGATPGEASLQISGRRRSAPCVCTARRCGAAPALEMAVTHCTYPQRMHPRPMRRAIDSSAFCRPLYNPTPEQLEEDRKRAFESGVPHGLKSAALEGQVGRETPLRLTVSSTFFKDDEFGIHQRQEPVGGGPWFRGASRCRLRHTANFGPSVGAHTSRSRRMRSCFPGESLSLIVLQCGWIAPWRRIRDRGASRYPDR